MVYIGEYFEDYMSFYLKRYKTAYERTNPNRRHVAINMRLGHPGRRIVIAQMKDYPKKKVQKILQLYKVFREDKEVSNTVRNMFKLNNHINRTIMTK